MSASFVNAPVTHSCECALQVTEECRQRGELMADVWIAYTTVLETVMTRMHQLCLEDRDR